MRGLKWTKKTSRKLSWVLKRRGYPVGPDTVRRLLRQRRYVLRANRKRLNKMRDPDRDRQMRHLARERRAYQKAGSPVISVDAKQRELIGNFKNPGRTWRQTRLDVLESDYPSEAEGIAIPYGIYDLKRMKALWSWARRTRYPSSRWRPFAGGGSKSGEGPTRVISIC